MLIKIYANDGKEFKGENYSDLVNKLNAYESEQKLKKEKEEAERKEREETKKRCIENLNNYITSMNKAIENYEKATGEKLQFVTENVTENGKLAVKRRDEYSDWLDFFMKI